MKAAQSLKKLCVTQIVILGVRRNFNWVQFSSPEFSVTLGMEKINKQNWRMLFQIREVKRVGKLMSI